MIDRDLLQKHQNEQRLEHLLLEKEIQTIMTNLQTISYHVDQKNELLEQIVIKSVE